MNALINILLIPICLTMLSACAGNDFNKAKQANTYGAYKEFLTEHPSSSLVPEARRLQELSLWHKAKTDNTLESYNTYLDTYPAGEFTDAAITAREHRMYKRACDSDKTALYREYIHYYPSGQYKDAANNRLATLAAYDRIARVPEQYVSISIYPVNASGKMMDTPIISHKKEEPSLRNSGVVGSALLSAFGFQGASASTIIRLVPIVESRADIPLEVHFNVELAYKRSVYNSMYQYNPDGGWATSTLSAKRHVTERLEPGEKKVGSIIDLGEFKLAEEGRTLITTVKINREIESIRVEDITLTSPMTGIEQSYCHKIVA